MQYLSIKKLTDLQKNICLPAGISPPPRAVIHNSLRRQKKETDLLCMIEKNIRL